MKNRDNLLLIEKNLSSMKRMLITQLSLYIDKVVVFENTEVLSINDNIKIVDDVVFTNFYDLHLSNKDEILLENLATSLQYLISLKNDMLEKNEKEENL